jgi:hypothetical protein
MKENVRIIKYTVENVKIYFVENIKKKTKRKLKNIIKIIKIYTKKKLKNITRNIMLIIEKQYKIDKQKITKREEQMI